MRLLIIRHGQSEADMLNVHEGIADYPLTEKGHNQAKVMAQYIYENYTIDKLYASPLQRAYQTAKYISKLIKKDIIQEENLKEFNNGLLAGLTFEEADIKYPIVQNLPITESVYGQETLIHFRQRAENVLQQILTENKDTDTIAIVTHGKIINQLYHAYLDLPIETKITYYTGDVGIHEWLNKDTRKIIVKSNYQPYK